ncbi:hypothetical protein A4G20_07475 [Pasteurellaceae bacterium RH1A]|nr:hypothetical protein A4G20_07475 [Pasteurellaceae bacterium RH1A]
MLYWILSYFLLVNLISFSLVALDKKRARANQWRISENALLTWCLAGGFIGTYLAMKYVRHKTKHGYFMAAVVISALGWGLLLERLWHLAGE